MRPQKSHYARAAGEVSRGFIDTGLLAMATAEALGNEKMAQAIYVRLRAEEISRTETSERATDIIEAVKEKARSTKTFIGILYRWMIFGSVLLTLLSYAAFSIIDLIFGTGLNDWASENIGLFLSLVLIACGIIAFLRFEKVQSRDRPGA